MGWGWGCRNRPVQVCPCGRVGPLVLTLGDLKQQTPGSGPWELLTHATVRSHMWVVGSCSRWGDVFQVRPE